MGPFFLVKIVLFLGLSIFSYAVSLLQPDHFLPWMSWHSEVAAFFAAIFLVIFSIQRMRISSNYFVEIPGASLALLFLSFLVLIQTIFGLIQFVGDAVVYTLYLLTGAFTVAAGHFFGGVNRDKSSVVVDSVLTIFSILFLLLAVVSGLISICQVLGVDDSVFFVLHPLQARRPGANIGQPNHLSTLVSMGLLGLYFCYVKDLFGKLLATLLLSILTLAVVITESRTGILSVLALLIFWRIGTQGGNKKKEKVLIFAYLSILIILVILWPKLFSFYQNGGANSEWLHEQPNTKLGSRMVVWPQLIEAAMQRPWFGWGVGGVSRAHNEVLDKYLEGEPFTYAHNIFLDLLIGVGVPVALVFMGLLLYFFFYGFRKNKDVQCWVLIAFLLPVFIHSLFEFPFAYSYFLFPWLFLFGVVGARFGFRVYARIKLGWFSLVLLLLVSFLSWSVFEYMDVEADFRVARFEAVSIGETPSEYIKPNIILLTQMSSLLVVARTQPHPGMSSVEIEQMKRVAQRFPWTATQNRYALTLALNGQIEEAKRQLEVMRIMHGPETHKKLMEYWRYQSIIKYPQLQSIF